MREIVESETEQTERATWNDINDLISQATPKIFDFNYPFYTDNAQTQQEFEEQFIRRYLYREIGVETYGRWKTRLQAKLYDIMPYYTRLFEIQSTKYNLFDNTNMTRTQNTDTTGTANKHNTISDDISDTDNTTDKKTTNIETENTLTGSQESTGNSATDETTNTENRNSFSATPQGSLTNVENGQYLTNYNYIKDNITLTNKTNTTNTSTKNETNNTTSEDITDYTSNKSRERTQDRQETENADNTSQTQMEESWIGKEGGESYADIKRKEAEVYWNINLMIYNDLECLFMGVF